MIANSKWRRFNARSLLRGCAPKYLNCSKDTMWEFCYDSIKSASCRRDIAIPPFTEKHTFESEKAQPPYYYIYIHTYRHRSKICFNVAYPKALCIYIDFEEGF